MFAALAAWIHYSVDEKDKKGAVVWRYLFYGFLWFAAVSSETNSWADVDYNRQYYQ